MECLILQKRPFSQVQAFRQKSPFLQWLEESSCLLQRESFLPLTRGTCAVPLTCDLKIVVLVLFSTRRNKSLPYQGGKAYVITLNNTLYMSVKKVC